jgi:NADPH:quinone reductase-like Zn-dependent oxidoreductase
MLPKSRQEMLCGHVSWTYTRDCLDIGADVVVATYYKDRRAGCFQELVVVPQHTVFTIPACLDFASAASLGVGPLTAAMSLWRWLGVPMQMESETSTDQAPATKPKEMMLVWGGSTVTGQTAIQIAAQAGIDVIAVCSKSTASLVSSLGATHIVTYTGKTDSEVVEEIVSLAGDSLTKAIDLVGAKTAQLVLQVIEGCGSKVDFAPLAFMSSKASVPSNAVVHTVEMKQFVLDKESEKYGMQLNDMLEQKALTLPKLRVLQGGLAAVEKGLKTLKAGELQGEKLVVTMG